MKELNGYLIVEVPRPAFDFSIRGGRLFYDLPGAMHFTSKELPPGSYEIVELESVVGELVDGKVIQPRGVGGQTVDYRFMNYETGRFEFRDPEESFESWKRKEGMKNVVILKKVNL